MHSLFVISVFFLLLSHAMLRPFPDLLCLCGTRDYKSLRSLQGYLLTFAAKGAGSLVLS